MMKVSALSLVLSAFSALSFDVAGDVNRPVTKVINLLKDMLAGLDKEQKEDEAIYDNMACWCQSNDKEKSGAIAEAEAQIERLTTKIEKNTATSARLDAEIKNHNKEAADSQDALDKATAIREKGLTTFNAEEKDMLESITAMKAAIKVLAKHNGAKDSLLQVPSTHMLGVAATVGYQLEKHAALLQGVLSPSERRTIASFVQEPTFFDKRPNHLRAYSSQSGDIFGTLNQMLETFEANLSEEQKKELADQANYEELKATKEEEIKISKAEAERKSSEKAAIDEETEQDKQSVEDTKASLSADQQYLMSLKEKCKLTDAEWEQRQKTRADEREAVSQALSVLSTDAAHDTYTRTFNSAFLLQEASSAGFSKRRSDASQLLAAVADKMQNPRLATLAVQVRLDAFTKVKAAIDKMIADLLKEKADEVKHKDYCVNSLDENQLQTESKTRENTTLTEKIAATEMHIADLSNQIKALKKEIADAQVALKQAGENREAANKEFQSQVADQSEVQKLLSDALRYLEGFYAKSGAALVQQEPAGPPPPKGFKEYKAQAASGGVLKLIQQILEDTTALKAEAVRAEEDSQKMYATLVMDTNAAIKDKDKSITNLSKNKADAEIELNEAKQSLASAMATLDQLSTEEAELHTSCDFTIRNFDVRQEARDQEVEALRQAKAILSGSKFEEAISK